jgi:hypothetical protein
VLTPRQQRPGASMATIGRSSLDEHYEKVMKHSALLEHAALVASRERATAGQTQTAKHRDPAAPITAGFTTPDNELDVFNRPRRHGDPIHHRRKAPDLGGDGILLGDERKVLSEAEKRRAIVEALPTAIRQLTPVRIVDEMPASSAAANTKQQVARTAARQAELKTRNAELESTGPTSVLRTAPFMRALLKASGGWGIRPLRLALRARDTKGDGIISVLDAKKAAATVGVEIGDDDAELLRRAGAPPGADAGKLLVPQLLEVLRGPPLAAARMAAVRAAYHGVRMRMNKERGDGAAITLAELCRLFNPRAHVAYDPHDKSNPRQLQQAFSRLWGPDFTAASPVGEEHFVGFFRDVSVCVTMDAQFTRMMAGLFEP